MVKNKNDKTKLGNWEEGDIFALKINSEKYPEYNNKYIILIHSIISKDGWAMPRTTNSFRAKITKNTQLPTTKKEIEDLEYIKTYAKGYNIVKNKYPKDIENINADKYHFIYTYLLVINSSKFQVPKELIYLGNFGIQNPNNEYIPNSRHDGVLFSFWNEKYSKITEKLLNCYNWYNLKQAKIFSKEFQENFLEYETREIQINIYSKKLIDAIDGPNGKEILKSMGIDIDKEKRTKHSETYVGEQKISTRKRQE